MTPRYDAPSRTARAFNTLIRRLAERGVSIQGSTAVQVRGRKSGRPHRIVVNLLTVEGRRYLVSPRGDSQWARNVRAAGEVEVGARGHAHRHRAVELPDDAKPPLLRAYLRRWYWQVKGHTGGLTPDSTDTELRAAAGSIPVFELL
ncbi:nitroreductase family deazaflavin-dependent oxidoreductase [Mycolicibacterium vaccae]|uniref:nitroreductase family deazaflavin-dependent oxidoreductase n=1 Tax=Mycolicibacterium vaccae TaxID=1810 RepID=UPI003CFA1700